MLYRGSAPGSLMIIGEHAVLHGYSAVAAAIDKRVYVTLRRVNNKKIRISTAGHEALELSSITESYSGYYKFVFASIKSVNKLKRIDFGLEIQIDSEIRDDLGLGSSAAVVVATIAALVNCLDISISEEQLFSLACQAIMIAQSGVGSCSDVAASICGGMVQVQNHKFSKLGCKLPKLCTVYSGYKTKTVDVIKKVESYNNTDKVEIYKRMGRCTDNFIVAMQKEILDIGNYFLEYQFLMRELGVSDPTIEKIISELKNCGFLYSKISGSGLGDCIIAIEDKEAKKDNFKLFDNVHVIDVSLSRVGVIVGEREAVYS